MAIRIGFDKLYNPEEPTLVLATRTGKQLGELKRSSTVLKDSLNDKIDLNFKTYKYYDGELNYLWDEIIDFRFIYVPQWDAWLQLTVETDEDDTGIWKFVECIGLAEAELSQKMLYDIQINTEDDIARDDYTAPTVFYSDDPKISLWHRITEKARNYSLEYVDPSLKNIQRTFEFDEMSIQDAINKIEEEIGCIFIQKIGTTDKGTPKRTFKVYDLQSNCITCGYRGEFNDVCPKCGSTQIKYGYGDDTGIYVTADELSDNISFSTDTDAVKNVFKLEAGDDLMTATVRNVNPNGTDYIYYITENMRADMSKALQDKIKAYDVLYNQYMTTKAFPLSSSLRGTYNSLIQKYNNYAKEYSTVPATVTGYSEIIRYLYEAMGFAWFLESEFMPTVTIPESTSAKEGAKLTPTNLSPVAVENINRISATTADQAVISMAEAVISPLFEVSVATSLTSGTTWQGSLTVTKKSDKSEKFTTPSMYISIQPDFNLFIRQRIDKILAREEAEIKNIKVANLVKLPTESFRVEMQKYALRGLEILHKSVQKVLDLLVEREISNSSKNPNEYNQFYLPYYTKLNIINQELVIREQEVNSVRGMYYNDVLAREGWVTYLDSVVKQTQKDLNFDKYLGTELLQELDLFKREDKYVNDNYISDGLNDKELLDRAKEFIDKAREALYKTSELQHRISATLRNLLVMEKFEPLVKGFEVGNWIRVESDEKIYKLRLLSYEIRFDELEYINVEFSDVTKTRDGISDVQSILAQASSMATSYNDTARQASQGAGVNKIIIDWRERGLAMTHMNIVNNSTNQSQIWDETGMLFRKFDEETKTYDDEQLKIINSTIALTNDKWKTTKTAIGKFYYMHPITGQVIPAYGINGETLVGKLILGEELGIYNENNTITLDRRGFNATNGVNTITIDPNSNSSLFSIANALEKVFYLDDKGNLNMKGSIYANYMELTGGAKITSSSVSGLSPIATSGDYKDLLNKPVNAYFYTAWADSADGKTGFSTTTADGKKYIGIYSSNVDLANKQDYTKYSWSQIKAVDGVQLYTWIKYADTPTSGMSNDPAGKAYIGMAYNKTTPTESNNYADYTWSKYKGDDGDKGLKGDPGKDGVSTYTHIAYGNGQELSAVINPSGNSEFTNGITGYTKNGNGTYSTKTEGDTTYLEILNETSAGFYTPGTHNTGVYSVVARARAKSSGAYMNIGFLNSGGTSTRTTFRPTSQWTTLFFRYDITNSSQIFHIYNQGSLDIDYIRLYKGDYISDFSMSDPSNKTHIGIYVDTIEADSPDWTKYNWTLIKGADGANGSPGKPGDDGRTPYFHVAYANSADGKTGFSVTDSANKLYIGQYTDYTLADSTDPTKYKWTLIKGADGMTTFVWIKYANTPTSGMSDYPDGKQYIGFAYNKTTQTESTNYADYTWSLIKGADGVKGDKGENGQQFYTWIKYADSETGAGMSDSPTGKRFLGIAVNQLTPTESTKATDYVWSPLYDNVVVGGRNLILNSGVELCSTSLSTNNSPYLNWNRMPVDLMQTLEGMTLTLSFDIKIDTSDGLAKDIQVYGQNNQPMYSIKAQTVNVRSGIYERKFITFVPSKNASYVNPTNIEFWGKVPEVTKICVKNVKLEKGNIPTDYTPAPEDLETVVNRTTQKVTDFESIIGENGDAIVDRVWSNTKYIQDTAIAANRNLLLNSAPNLISSSYNIANFEFLERPIVGETYVFTLKGNLGTDRTMFRIYNSGGSVPIINLKKVGEGYYQGVGKWVAVSGDAGREAWVYQMTSAGTQPSTIEWIKMEKGTKATLEWYPAIEDTNSFPNLLTNASFDYNKNSWMGLPESRSPLYVLATSVVGGGNNSILRRYLSIPGLLGEMRYLEQDISKAVMPNTTYTVSGYVAYMGTTSGTNSINRAGVRVGTTITNFINPDSNSFNYDFRSSVKSVWMRFVYRFTTGSDTTGLRLMLLNADTGVEMRFDDIVMVKGGIAKANYTDSTIGLVSRDDYANYVEENAAIQAGITNGVSGLTDRLQRAESKITDDAIALTVTNSSKYRSDLDNIRRAQIDSTNTLKTTISGFQDVFKQTVEGLDGKISEVTSYFRYDAVGGADRLGQVEIGASNSPFVMNLSSKELAFMDSGKKVAYINNQQLFIEDAIIGTAQIGNHRFEKIGNDITVALYIGG